jgi:deoxyribonuclease IV
MAGLRLGAHVDQTDPVAEAQARDADLVQFFLGDPQGYKGPEIRYAGGAAGLRKDAEEAGIDLYVHAPYIVNVATTNNRIRIPSRKLLGQHAAAAAAIGARAMVVHGGHVLAKDDPAVGVDNWRKTFARQAEEGGFPLPILVENTAGGGNAMARDLDAIGRLWDAIGEFGAGFVLDTCHAWAAGWDLANVVDAVRAVTGRIDLMHLNNSRDPAGSSRDRHAPLADGEIPTDLLVEVVRAADCPVILETPGDSAAHAEEIGMLRQALRT